MVDGSSEALERGLVKPSQLKRQGRKRRERSSDLGL